MYRHLFIAILYIHCYFLIADSESIRIYTGCISKNLTVYKNARHTKPTFHKWSSLLILQQYLSLDQSKVKNGNILKGIIYEFFNRFFEYFFTVKILIVRFLPTHPVDFWQWERERKLHRPSRGERNSRPSQSRHPSPSGVTSINEKVCSKLIQPDCASL